MQKEIRTLKPSELDDYHFRDSEWQPVRTAVHWLFHINRIEDLRGKLRFPILPHRKTLYDFLFLTHGNTRRSKGLNEYTFSANTFFFLPAYQISTHESMSDDATGFFCHFDMSVVEQIFPNNSILSECSFLQPDGEPVVPIEPAFMKPLTSLLERLEREYAQPQQTDFSIVAVYLMALFTELKQLTQPLTMAKKNAAFRITQAYKNALSQYIYKKQHVTDYADLLAVTPDHLNKCVRLTTGKSAQDLLMDMLLLEAKVLLHQTQLPISEIAFKLSEKSPSDFSRFFKTKTGLTPKQYKQLTGGR